MAGKITASILYDYVHCPHRVYLDAFGDSSKKDEISSFVKLLWEEGYAFEKQMVAQIDVPFADLSELRGREKERATLKAIAAGEALIYSGRISHSSELGEPDLLRREKNGYVAGDIKSGVGLEAVSGGGDAEGRPKKHYAVQLALYTDILHKIGAGDESRGFIWDRNREEVSYEFDKPLGRGSRVKGKAPGTLWEFYAECRRQVEDILKSRQVTRPAYSGKCKLCHWYSACFADLKASDDLTLIPDLGRSKRDVICIRIPTMSDLAKADLGLYVRGGKTVFAGVGAESLEKYQTRARLITDVDTRPSIRGDLRLPSSPNEIFFDVETDPMRDICYLHGFYVRTEGNSEGRYYSFFADAPSPEAEREAFAGMLEFLKGYDRTIIYYYSKYERTICRGLQRKYPDVCSQEAVEEMFAPEKAVDLYFDVVRKHTEWPTYNHSIKSLAQYLGFQWSDDDPSGASSIEWYHRWTETGDQRIRDRIIQYNRDDCAATAVLLDGIRDLLR